MFTMPAKENPLHNLIAAAGSGAAQGALQQREQARRSQDLEQNLNAINEDSSPFDIFQAINRIKNPEDKKLAGEMFKNLENSRKAGVEASRKQQVEKKKNEAEDRRKQALAAKYGSPTELLSEDWVPAIPGINYPGDYMRDYGTDPSSWIRNEQEGHLPVSIGVPS